MSKITKKRAGKTTLQQYRMILKELQNNMALKTNKNTPENPNALQESWDKLAKQLNSVGGPRRTSKAWKRIFVDWKSHVKRKARLLKINQRSQPPLNDVENQLIDAILPHEPPIILKIKDDITQNIASSSEPDKVDNNVYVVTTQLAPEDVLNPPKTKKSKSKSDSIKSGINAAVDMFMSIGDISKDIANELHGIKKQMSKANKIKKFKMKLEYEKAKFDYPHLNLDRDLFALSEDSE